MCLRITVFFRYYSGEKLAPILTIFIGGNHEASNYLQELAYGGWVAPNIYYLGYAGVINVNGVRIGGISGIFRDHHFEKGHFEVGQRGKLRKKIDIFLDVSSHHMTKKPPEVRMQSGALKSSGCRSYPAAWM